MDRQEQANQSDISSRQGPVENGGDTMATSDSNIRKKDHEQLEMYQGMKEKLERMWKEKAKVVRSHGRNTWGCILSFQTRYDNGIL